MKKAIAMVLASTSLMAIALGAWVVQAGGWDNFKLRYFHLIASGRDREFQDLRKQNINLERSTRIDLAQLLNGGPPKDGIPSIDRPQFDTAQTTPFSPEETAIGVVVNGEAKAYPFGILNWHEIVNDSVGGVNLSVSYCPLCDTTIVFERGATTYGVSGKLYQSCLVMYDRADDTLYSQSWAMGIVGANVNRHLPRIPAVKTTLKAWLREHPNSLILSARTGHQRNYLRYPYGSYYTDDTIIFPVRNQDRRTLHPKAIVSYIWEADLATPRVPQGRRSHRFSGVSHQFPHDELRKVGEQRVEFNGRTVKARWDEELETAIVEDAEGRTIPSSTAFAFVYPAYFGGQSD